MKLKLQRSQKSSGMISKSVVFALDARVELTPEEQDNLKKYKLGNQVIYNSEKSKKHLEVAGAALNAGAGGLLKGAARLAMAKLSLNITIEGLMRGQHIECKDLDELLGAEEAIMEACRSLKTYLDTAITFDGREVVIDFDEPTQQVAAA